MHTILIQDFKKSQCFTEGQIQENKGVVHYLLLYNVIGDELFDFVIKFETDN